VRYDPALPIAVFLGPSLSVEEARALLPANYYPPVRRGDVYRLIGTGVRLILIVDGVFHAIPPVWQRELLAALDAGIEVLGASSMGALRAAELEPFGMRGVGRIFEWYRDGVLDGDDEVALLHADESEGHRPLSLPLVNLRHDLARAEERRLIAAAEREALVQHTKQAWFGERSLARLLASPPASALGAERKAALREFLEREAEDLKRADALLGLGAAAARASELRLLEGTATPPRERRPALGPGETSGFPALETLWRGLWRDDGELVPAEAVLRAALADETTAAELRRDAAALPLLNDWADARELRAPDAMIAQARDEWPRDGGPVAERLRRAGLTLGELERELAARVRRDWLLAEGPEAFGLDFAAHRRAVAALARHFRARPGSADPGDEELLRRAALGRFLAAWAEDAGLACPEPEAADFVSRFVAAEGFASPEAFCAGAELAAEDFRRVFPERALVRFLLAQGPAGLGLRHIVLEERVLRELQLSGQAARLAAAWEPA